MRKLFLIALLVMTTVISTGCMKAVLRFNPDGSGSFEFGMNLSVQSLQEASMMSGAETDAGLDEIGELLMSGEARVDEKTGISLRAEERLQNGSIWTYMIAEVPNAEAWANLEEALAFLAPSEEDAEAAGPTDPTSFFSVPNITVDGSTLRVELTVPSTVDAEASAEDDPFGMAAMMGAFIQVSYEIEMPGTLGEHNGQIDSLTGNPVWLIDLTSLDDLEIVVESTLD